MNTLTLNSKVVFRRPFVLTGLDGEQPPGSYDVETYSELLDIPNVVAYRRLATSIELHGQPAGIVRRATIDPAELEAALIQDAASESMLAVAVPVVVGAGGGGTVAGAGATPMVAETGSVEWHHGGPVEFRRRKAPWRGWLGANATELAWIIIVFGGMFALNLTR